MPCPYSQYGCEKAKVPKRIVEQHDREDVHKHLKLAVKEKKFQSTCMLAIIVIIMIIMMIIMIKENEECPLQETECPYSQYGCEVKYLRGNLKQHENEDIQKNLNLTLTNLQSEVTTLQKENEEYRSSLQEGKEDIHKQMKLAVIKESDHLRRFQSLLIPMISILGAEGNLEWKIRRVKKKISQKEDTYSDPFYVGMYKFQGWVQWVSDDNYVGLFLSIMKGEWDDALKWPIRYTGSLV